MCCFFLFLFLLHCVLLSLFYAAGTTISLRESSQGINKVQSKSKSKSGPAAFPERSLPRANLTPVAVTDGGGGSGVRGGVAGVVEGHRCEEGAAVEEEVFAVSNLLKNWLSSLE